MVKLFIDDFVREQGFRSTLQYLKYLYNNHATPRFKGAGYFLSLFKAGIILPDYSSIRVMYTAGGQDESYSVTQDGKLEGMMLEVYSGKPGIHDPAEVLSIENAPDGWDLENFRLPRPTTIKRAKK